MVALVTMATQVFYEQRCRGHRDSSIPTLTGAESQKYILQNSIVSYMNVK